MANGLFEMGDRVMFDNSDYGYQYDQDRLLELIKKIRNFDKLTHDFGAIAIGVEYTTTFKFTNTGDEKLVFTSVKGSCTCTVPEYTKEAIEPGESGEIKVKFKPGMPLAEQTKYVTITANTNNLEIALNLFLFIFFIFKDFTILGFVSNQDLILILHKVKVNNSFCFGNLFLLHLYSDKKKYHRYS